MDRGVRPIGDWSMSITLSSWSSPSIPSWAPGSPMRAVQVAGQGLAEDVVDQRALARAGDARHADEHPQREGDVDALEVVVPRPLTVSRRPSGALRCGRNGDGGLAGEVGAGEALLGFRQVGERPLGDDLAPLDAGARAEVDQPVGRAHRVLVVLDDDHRVAHVAEPLEGGDQAVVVARMQADRGLVEDVEHADQPGPDLAGQADPLGLAAGERRCRAVERQVVQPDVGQELEPGPDLLEELLGDRPRDGVEGDEISGRPWAGCDHPPTFILPHRGGGIVMGEPLRFG